ncbi:Uncharacterized protein Rs2_32348 [Raphanus sativus]|nr:Uncharacterized protein Rs2_32348 [Raphanus sativus]
MFLDIGGVSRRRRRDLHFSLFSVPLLLANSFNLSVFCCQCFVFAYVLLHSSSLPRPFLVGNRGIESFFSGLGLTGSGFLWGVPQKSASFTTYQSLESLSLKICIAGSQDVDYPPPCEADSSQRSRSITLRQASRVSSVLLTCYADLHTGEYQPLFWIDTAYLLGYGLHQPDLKLFLSPPRFGLSMKPITFHLKGISFRRTSRSSSAVSPPERRSKPTILLTPVSPWAHVRRCSFIDVLYRRQHVTSFIGLDNYLTIVSLVSSKFINYLILSPSFSSVLKPSCMLGELTTLVNFRKITEGFLGIFTETGMHTMSYLSYGKSSLCFLLPMDSPGLPILSSSLTSFSQKKRTVLSPASFMRIVFPPNVKWRCVSLSIAVLSSCVAVRLGPENATDVITMIFRGADWILTSQFKVTGGAMNLALTHSSFAVNSLSFYRGGLFTIILYVSVVLSFVGRVWLNSIFICNPNV